MIARNEADEIIKNLSEEDGFTLVNALESKFGWACTLYTRGDVESYISRDLTDEEWEKVKGDYGWRKFSDVISETAWTVIGDTVIDQGIEWD